MMADISMRAIITSFRLLFHLTGNKYVNMAGSERVSADNLQIAQFILFICHSQNHIKISIIIITIIEVVII